MSLKYWVFCFFLGSKLLLAQEFKLLSGKLVHEELSVQGIHIVNKDRGSAEITDVDGYFEISVRLGETLVFSGVQYQTKEITIDDDLFNAQDLVVYLDAFVNTLDEVVVKSHELSGDLNSDLSNANINRPLNFYDVGIPGFKGEPKEKIVSGKSLILSTLLLPLSGGVNIDAVYKHLSGYYTSLKKKRAMEADFNIVYEIIRFYGVYFFVENYALTPEEVYVFVTGCYENTTLKQDFKMQRHQDVIAAFDTYSKRFNEN